MNWVYKMEGSLNLKMEWTVGIESWGEGFTEGVGFTNWSITCLQ